MFLGSPFYVPCFQQLLSAAALCIPTSSLNSKFSPALGRWPLFNLSCSCVSTKTSPLFAIHCSMSAALFAIHTFHFTAGRRDPRVSAPTLCLLDIARIFLAGSCLPPLTKSVSGACFCQYISYRLLQCISVPCSFPSADIFFLFPRRFILIAFASY
jgi:hypothetical protein